MNDKHLKLLYHWLVISILVLIVVHAPLTVWLGSVLPGFELYIKAWKEVLMTVAIPVGLWLLHRKDMLRGMLSSPLVWVVGGYVLIHGISLMIWNGWLSTGMGLMINLRYIVYFMLVVIYMMLFPERRNVLLWLVGVGALVVVGFGLLQQGLSKDLLTRIGYNETTIKPFLTVDENPNFVRHNSTLRGPNPLGAYLAMCGSVAVAWLVGRSKSQKQRIFMIIAVIATTILMYLTYSRSAYLALGVGIVVVLVLQFGKKIHWKYWVLMGCVGVVGLVGSFAARHTPFVSTVVFHADPHEGNARNSDDQHAESLKTGLERMAVQPLGKGVGSTGTPSLKTNSPLILENQYLYIAHEVGWVGLALFLALFGIVLKKLWHERRDWLARGVFASGVGLAIVGLVQPVWVDDTVAIIWWALAAIVIGGAYGKRTRNKKTTRTA